MRKCKIDKSWVQLFSGDFMIEEAQGNESAFETVKHLSMMRESLRYNKRFKIAPYWEIHIARTPKRSRLVEVLRAYEKVSLAFN